MLPSSGIDFLVGPEAPHDKEETKDKQENAADLTLDEVQQMIEHGKANPPKKGFKRKKQ